jgi:amino acid adenylation domain-containing protein
VETLSADFLCVLPQISESRAQVPESIALSCGDRQLTYQNLCLRAEKLAAYLRQLGVTPGSTVALCMERSIDWIVAALAIMQAGCAYVPLDSAWPDSRLRFAVEDAGAVALVARSALLERLAVKAHGVDPSRDAAAIAAMPAVSRDDVSAQDSLKTISPDSLAYMIYTSGSTGVPKGVEITHANLSHLVQWHREAFGVSRADRASHLASLGFDAAVWEIWPYLCAGATLCLANDEVRSSPQVMQQWMIRERVTIGFVPTVHAGPLMAMEWPATTRLRYMLTGGDKLHSFPGRQLPFKVVNNYGPAECTVVSTSTILEPGSLGTPSIGRAITGASVYLLNERGEQVRDGEVGEIYIGGNGVGRGYRNLPDSTERNFLPDPFAGLPGARMYRSGDCGCRRGDGEIEFRGRIDRQAKIRGQRVELDEIGSILMQYPGIDFAAATLSKSGADDQLTAHVLFSGDQPVPNAQSLQQHLLRSLPEYMVPSVFVRLDSLPLSSNGKIDLATLPQPSDANRLQSGPRKEPATLVEEKLLAMVKELLDNPDISVEDNFFLAGGHSLLGMQLVIRLRNAFGLDLTLRQLFEGPTVERLAVLIENKLIDEVNAISDEEAEISLTE